MVVDQAQKPHLSLHDTWLKGCSSETTVSSFLVLNGQRSRSQAWEIDTVSDVLFCQHSPSLPEISLFNIKYMSSIKSCHTWSWGVSAASLFSLTKGYEDLRFPVWNHRTSPRVFRSISERQRCVIGCSYQTFSWSFAPFNRKGTKRA